MGSSDLARIVSDCATNSNIILLENHGVLTLGNSLLQAFERIEVLELAAKMNIIVGLIGDKKALGKERIDEIDKLFG
jgi:L-fuculose-phosphate aldolase